MGTKKGYYRVLVVHSLREFAGRESFMGVLEEMSNKKRWHLDVVSPNQFSMRTLANTNNEPFDGYIISEPGSDAVMKHIADSHMPTVLCNITDKRTSARSDAVSSVWSDNADAGRRAAKHLLERGRYASAGYVHEIDFAFYSTERMMAFRATMKKENVSTAVFDSHKAKDFAAELRKWIRNLPKPTAIMACSDMRAADIINICRKDGIQVPEQVAVIGVDNDTAQHEKCGMSISSVILNMRDMGRQTVRELDFLFRHTTRHGRPHEILVPAKGVFVGESTARSASAARLVDAALAFIKTNCTKRISATALAKHLGYSRQLVELRFSQISGKTIRQTIEDVRMEEAMQRLKNGEPVRSIVHAMHFTSANQFYRIYKRHFGHTITQSISGGNFASGNEI